MVNGRRAGPGVAGSLTAGIVASLLMLAALAGCAIPSPLEATQYSVPVLMPGNGLAERSSSVVYESDRARVEPPEAPSRDEGRVIRVVDGETIEVSIDGRSRVVRLIGVDTPQPLEAPGARTTLSSLDKSRELVSGRLVHLERDVSEMDSYGRLLRYAYVGDTFVNAEMIRQGLARARPVPPDVKHKALFRELERRAREAGTGLWSSALPSPTATRAGERPASDPALAGSYRDAPQAPRARGKYFGSKFGSKYHEPGCPRARDIDDADRVWFSSISEARSRGYDPCKSCDGRDYR